MTATALKRLCAATCSAVILLLFCGAHAAYAAAPPPVLATYLQHIAANGGSQQDIDGAKSILTSESITPTEWQTFFDGYFASNPLNDNLGFPPWPLPQKPQGFLYAQVFDGPSDQATRNLQQGIYSSMLSNLSKVIGADTPDQLQARLSADSNAVEDYFNSAYVLQRLYISAKTTPAIQQAIYTGYEGLIQARWADIFDPSIVFSKDATYYPAWIRAELQIDLAEAYLADPGRFPASEKDTVAALIEPSLEKRAVWKDQNVALIDNNSLDITQTQRISSVLANIPVSMRDLGLIKETDLIGGPAEVRLQLLYRSGTSRNNGVNILPDRVGTSLEDGIDDGIAQQADAFTMGLIHEANHHVQVTSIDSSPALAAREDALRWAAGTTPLNYIRSQVVRDDPAFFQDGHAPQEFFASISNAYFQDSMATLNLCLARYQAGYFEPIKQFMFFVDVYSQGQPTSYFYTVDSLGNMNRTQVGVTRLPDGRASGLVVNGTPYDFSRYVESTPPTVSITSPSYNATITGPTTVSIDATDNYGVARVDLWVYDASGGYYLYGTKTSPPYSFTIDPSAMTSGTSYLIAQAYDSANNVAVAYEPVQVPLQYSDKTPPVVSIVNPADKSAAGGTVDVKANASDNGRASKVEFYVDGTRASTQTAAGADGHWGFSWDTRALTGIHTVTAKAFDEAGNATTSSAANVAIDAVYGPRSYWKFDEASGTAALDSSGRGCTGTVNGATWTSGHSGGALAFNGTSNSVTMGVSPSLAGTTPFTVAAWIKTPSATSDQVIVQQRDYRGFNGEYQFRVNQDGTLGFTLYGDWAYQFEFSSPGTVNDGKWHHVVAERKGDNGYLYIDGVRVAQATGPARNLDPSWGVVVGADTWDIANNRRFFNGTIDDVRIYDSALSDQQVNDLCYHAQSPSPAGGATAYSFRPTTLAWQGSTDSSSQSYNVYAGTNWSAVTNATTASAEFKGSQTTTSYAMRFLDPAIYYWRIDSVNGGVASKGDVWSFTVSNGLQAYWKFNEGSGAVAYDSSGRGCTGTVSGGVGWTTGTSGTALYFHGGSNDRVACGTAPSLSGLTDFSVAAWVNTTSTAEGDIVEQGGGGSEGQYVLQLLGDGTANFMVYGQGTYQFNFHTAKSVRDGVWHHLSAVRSGNTGYLYIDGSRVASATGTAVSLDPALSVMLGADSFYTSKYFKGKIDDVRIYNTALSDQEVKDVYGWGPDKTPPTPNPMTWATPPTAAGTSSIAMTATAAYDASGTEYCFTCMTPGGHSGAWQAGRTYTDTGLTPNTRYTYTVKARDKSYYQNETLPSASAGATTASTYYPSSYQVKYGTWSSGTTQSLVYDDNNYLVINSQTSGSPRYATTDTTTTNIPVAAPAKIDVKVITKSSASSTTQKIRLYNFRTGVWDQKDSITNLTTSELARMFSITTSTSDYISQGKLRLETEGSKSTSFSLSHEVVQVTITP